METENCGGGEEKEKRDGELRQKEFVAVVIVVYFAFGELI